jgi:hypothetical protein
LGLNEDPPWQAGVHLYAPKGTAPDFVKKPHQANDFVAHCEVGQGDFWPGRFVRIQLHISQRDGPRIEYGLRVPDLEVLDAAVIDGLAQPHQRLARRRKV